MTTTSSRFRRWRRAAFAAQALVVLGLPFVRVGGESALRFDVPSLTLHAFGAALQIDELFLVLAAALALGAAFVLATVVLGRAWCGWACPQTALLEATRLGGPLRWAATAAASALVSANLLWYFVTPQDFFGRLAAGDLGPVLAGSWAALGVVVFADLRWFRYRWCAAACPYAKLQGALFDAHTLVVAFDPRRAAECVECRACVRACPVGIDIRDGLQTECIACAECADACGPIMARLGRANLVGYSFGEPGTARRLVRPLAVALAALALASLALLGVASARRSALDVVASSTPGSTPRWTPDGRALNSYDVSVANRGRGEVEVTLALRVAGEPAELQPAAVRLGPGEHRRLRVLAAVRASPGGPALEARLDAAVRADERLRMTRTLTFVPPGESRR